MLLGDKVRGRRLQLGLSQKELADRTGLSQETISRVESGKVAALRTEALRRLAAALYLSMDYLVGLVESPSGVDYIVDDSSALRLLSVYSGMDKAGRDLLWNVVEALQSPEAGSANKAVAASHEPVLPASEIDLERGRREYPPVYKDGVLYVFSGKGYVVFYPATDAQRQQEQDLEKRGNRP